jgi:hypothetical protein
MLTLTYGFKKPQTGDKGGGVSGFWAALELNFQKLNDHTHSGSDSARLTSAAMTAVTQSISAVGWASSGSGFRQLVTMPGALLYDDYDIRFKDGTSKEPIFLGITKNSANTYYVYCNDNTVTLTAFYLS